MLYKNLSQMLKQRSSGIEQAYNELVTLIRSDIDEKIRSKTVPLYVMARETDIIYTNISHVRNKRRAPSKEFVQKYIKWLEERGE